MMKRQYLSPRVAIVELMSCERFLTASPGSSEDDYNPALENDAKEFSFKDSPYDSSFDTSFQ